MLLKPVPGRLSPFAQMLRNPTLLGVLRLLGAEDHSCDPLRLAGRLDTRRPAPFAPTSGGASTGNFVASDGGTVGAIPQPQRMGASDALTEL